LIVNGRRRGAIVRESRKSEGVAPTLWSIDTPPSQFARHAKIIAQVWSGRSSQAGVAWLFDPDTGSDDGHKGIDQSRIGFIPHP
jgi:hypothetical protein